MNDITRQEFDSLKREVQRLRAKISPPAEPEHPGPPAPPPDDGRRPLKITIKRSALTELKARAAAGGKTMDELIYEASRAHAKSLRGDDGRVHSTSCKLPVSSNEDPCVTLNYAKPHQNIWVWAYPADVAEKFVAEALDRRYNAEGYAR